MSCLKKKKKIPEYCSYSVNIKITESKTVKNLIDCNCAKKVHLFNIAVTINLTHFWKTVDIWCFVLIVW